MVNTSNLDSGKSMNSQRLSDLLDNHCDSSDFDELLAHANTKDVWYRFQTVSSILRNEHSAQETQLFCQEISAKLMDEPAIIAVPANKTRQLNKSNSKSSANFSPIRRFSSGLAIAASAAFVTFFSVQTLQLSDNTQPTNPQQQSVADAGGKDSSPKVSVEISDSLEQTELEFSSDLYIRGVLQSGNISEQQVSGRALVKTIRFSAKQWQQMLNRAIKKKAAAEAVQLNSDANALESESNSKEKN